MINESSIIDVCYLVVDRLPAWRPTPEFEL